MNKKLPANIRSLVLLLLILAAWIIKMYVGNSGDKDAPVSGDQDTIKTELSSKPLIYTKHARCRMECRNIDEYEVEEILDHGKVNYQKSEANDEPCPSYAIEGLTSSGQSVRIVYALCNTTTKVITAIDLEQEYQCECP